MDIFLLLNTFCQVIYIVITLLFRSYFVIVSCPSLSLLLSACLVGANPNIQDIDGDTPLHTCHLPSIAELLLLKGANPTILNNSGKTMAEQAMELENDDMVEFWKNRGKS